MISKVSPKPGFRTRPRILKVSPKPGFRTRPRILVPVSSFDYNSPVIEPGQTLLHYRVVDKIGEGGMGVVWRATDTTLDRDVAIKILPNAVAGDQERLLRFEREAKLLASLDHPNIATVHGLLTDGDLRFLAMELVRGEDLSERLARGPLSADDTVAIGRQIAAALEAAHEAGVIHRDLKPANVIVTDDNKVKVLDFGLAKSVEAAAGGGDVSASPTLTTPATVTGMIMGTAPYMSPEQARGQQVDRRADIWAYGCVLYECLTGHRLFTGDTVSDTLAAVLRAEPDWSELPSHCPPALERLLRRCLDRDPLRRLRDIGEARVALEGPLDEPTAVAQGAAGTARSRFFAPVAAIVLAALSATIAWKLHEGEPPPLRKFFDSSLTSDVGPWDTVGPAISPDGARLAFVRDRSLWIRELGDLEARSVPESEGATGLAWSPDSRWVAYTVGMQLYKVDTRGAAPIAIGQLPGGMSTSGGTAWMADGTLLLSTGGSGVLAVPSQGGDPANYLDPGENENDFHDVAALPDGHSILFVVHGEQGASVLATYDGEERRTLLELEGQWLRDPVYSPSGHVIFHRTRSNVGLWALPFSLERLEATGAPFLVAPGGAAPSVSGEGTLVYLKGAASRKRQLVILDRAGETIRTAGEPLDGMRDPALSPDGARIAVSAESASQRDIWIYDIESGTRNRLTLASSDAFYPRWFPDGERLAFICEEPPAICVRRADGSGETERIDVDASEELDVDSSGRLLMYNKNGRGTRVDLWLYDLDEESDTPFLDTPDYESAPRFSHDGRFLAYIAWELGEAEVFLREFPGKTGKWQVSSAGGSMPIWSDDEIFWSEGSELWARSVSVGSGVKLGAAERLLRSDGFDWGYDVSRDGEQIVIGITAGERVDRGVVIVQNWFAEFSGR